MLFLGNSYTFMGALDDVTEALFVAAGEEVTANRLAEPGWTFPQHVEAIETDGTAWQLAFDAPNDWVILQDQSQIPGFPDGQPDRVASQAAAVVLDGYAAGTGAQTMFLMTWGRRAGDEQNPELYPDYDTMQTALTAGYLDYAALASEDGTPAWVAPAGLAWRRVYDDVVAGGGDPLDPTSAFYGLYIADGSHPSERGTYLAACVIYASVTGLTPVGLGAPESVADAAYLQGVAAAVVLEGEGIAYPWQADPDDTGIDDTGTDDTDTDTPDDPADTAEDLAADDADASGCGCTAAPDGAGGWVLGFALLAVRRRGCATLPPPSPGRPSGTPRCTPRRQRGPPAA
jgi:MYXO-CTERM domain-containing protein